MNDVLQNRRTLKHTLLTHGWFVALALKQLLTFLFYLEDILQEQAIDLEKKENISTYFLLVELLHMFALVSLK